MPVLAELNLYPVKSCAGIALRKATLTAAGLMSEHIYDREWMVVGEDGVSLTQREYPKLALVTPRIKADTLELRAPGMMRLEVPLGLPDPEEAPRRTVGLWYDRKPVQAYDGDVVSATWFSQFLGIPCHLVRFHPHGERHADPRWTSGVQAPILYSDGYPVLVIAQASLDDTNQKLVAAGRDALPMNRFRPNIVLGGEIGPYEEDYAETVRIGEAVLKLVKPCPRCAIPSIDQATAIAGPTPLDIMQSFRANPILDGAVTFGMNAVPAGDAHHLLQIGQQATLQLKF
jgi:uncharacterized protein YcbX